jgi:hypothetical protein
MMFGNQRRPPKTVRTILVSMPKLALIVPLCGCGDAPSFDILGSYFPAWLVCILVGIAVSAAAGFCLSARNRQGLIRWSIVTYPCLAASIAFTLWLLLFS